VLRFSAARVLRWQTVMQLPSVIVADRRPALIPEIVIPSRRPAPPRGIAPRRAERERHGEPRRWTGALRGLLVDVYA
jgi:hypothetical protein